ncbi:hypothetical protein J437_LFUL012524 [Ladona fulva]|uniref:MADF domain-containing protein n=1 Tax=Ladona fulva TaxID=123851 RepID=A0A8K0KCE3_LADFU|nr:hypothetical protein J437_LFUL012524 [Ladona fulva]
MALEVDIERLISLVEEQPVLWDKTLESDKDRIQARNAWIEIFKQLNQSFEDINNQERNEYGRSVMKKWTNVLDSYNKCEKYKASLKSGCGRQPTSRYVYGQQLQYLKKTCPTEDTMSIGNEDPSEADGDDDLHTKESDELEKPIKNVNKCKLDPVELELIKIFQKLPDRHMSYFSVQSEYNATSGSTSPSAGTVQYYDNVGHQLSGASSNPLSGSDNSIEYDFSKL